MAERPINKDDFIESGAIQSIITDFDNLEKVLLKADKSAKDFAESMGKISSPDGAENFTKLQKQMEQMESQYKIQFEVHRKLSEVEKERNRVLKESAEEFRRTGKLAVDQNKAYKDTIGTLDVNIKRVQTLKVQLKALQKEQKDSGKWTAENATEQARLKESISQTNIIIKKQIREEGLASTSAQKLQTQLGLMRRAYREMSEEVRNSPVGQQLFADIQIVRGQVEEFNKSIGNFHDNIGNYGSALQNAAGHINLFGTNVGSLFSRMKGGISTIRGLTKGMSALRIAFISTGIGALVVAFASIVSYLQKTTEGSDRLRMALAPLRAIFEVFTHLVRDFGERIIDAFTNPREAINKFWELIKRQVVNRIEGLAGVFKSLAKIIKSGFTDGYKEMGQAVSKTITGVDDLQGRLKGIMKLSLERQKQLTQEKTRLDEINETYALQIGRLKRAFREQRLIQSTQGRWSEAGKKATQEAIRIEKERIGIVIDRLNVQKKIAMLEGQANGMQVEDRQKINDIQAEIEEAQASSLLILRRAMDGAKQLRDTTKELSKEEKNREKITRLRTKHERELLNLELKLISEGKSRLEINKDLVLFAEMQGEEMIKLLKLLNDEEQFTNEILKIQQGISSAVQQRNEDNKENEKIELLKKNTLQKQLEILQKQAEITAQSNIIEDAGKDVTNEQYKKRHELILEQLELEWQEQLLTLKKGSLEYEIAFENHNQRIEAENRRHQKEMIKDSETTWAQMGKTATDVLSESMQNLAKFYQDQSKLITDSQNKIIQNSQSTINALKQSAIAGNIQAKESILAEEKAIEEAQKRIEKAEKRRQAVQMASSLISSFNQKIASGKNGLQALGEVGAEMGSMQALIKMLPSFDAGADRLSGDGKGIDGKGGFLAINHPNERILTADQNKRIGFDYTNEQLVQRLNMPKQTNNVIYIDNSETLNRIENGLKNINNWSMDIQQMFSTIDIVFTKEKGGNIQRFSKHYKS